MVNNRAHRVRKARDRAATAPAATTPVLGRATTAPARVVRVVRDDRPVAATAVHAEAMAERMGASAPFLLKAALQILRRQSSQQGFRESN